MAYENIDITPMAGDDSDSKVGLFLKRFRYCYYD